MKNFNDFNASVVVVYGTEESAFECWADTFDNVNDAKEFADETNYDYESKGYDSCALVCSNQSEFESAVNEMIELRREWLEESGFDYDDDDLEPCF